MMKKIISLIKTDLNITYGLSALQYKFNNKRDRLQTILIAIALLSLIPTYIMIVSGLVKIYEAYIGIGQKTMFLLNGFIYAQLIVLLFGFLYVMSKYYFSNDLNVLVPLPLRPKDIVGAKFVTLMVNEYLTSLPIILPFIIIYGTRGKEGLLYWIYSFILIIFLPIIPLALASIIVMLFMKYTNIKGRKDLLRVVGYIILLIALLGFQFKIQSIAQQSVLKGEDFFLEMAQNSNILVRKLGLVFPPSMWAALSLGNYSSIGGVFNLLLFVGTSVIVFWIMIQLSEKLFFEGLIGGLEVATAGKHKEVKTEDLSKSSPPFLSIGLKEIKILLRTPVYLLNSVLGVLILPLVMVISTTMNGKEVLGELSMLTEGNSHIVSLVGIGIITMFGVMNCVGCTTFSREGKSFWIQRVMPIKARDQIFGRILSSLFVQIIGIISLLASLAFIINIDFENIFWITTLGLLGSVAMTELGMVIDIFRPLLDWDNPQKAMKQNLNVLIAMGIGALYLGGVGFLVYKLFKTGVNILAIYGIMGLIYIISSYGLYILLKNLIIRQFSILE
ncbi:ABC-2 type transport system permease protein [Keratinibaculum paraultunense]|uniref:ABC-2 type transport system permease protein n=1 Tax=Keratinibaculum paraultunense TaxID=1278232 RepID=A0A4R3L2X7_9FIRM|nr:hypothetical protein [Keratinibaculum paraultunense]QQY80010.1 hypothetical protein JL105_01365 [Keratinibaculum paraultunense]TCS91667.1 ABC-2 type transport system permease protein [Keratinibaculum paraultunense]